MKKIIPLVLFCAFVLSVQAQPVTKYIDSLLNGYAQLYRLNGSVLVARKGEVLLQKGYGYQQVAGKIPATANTIFQIGSVTKQFTAAIILKLQEQKKLSVNDKLSKYFPAYPKGDSVTIHQLLSHTSGIYDYTHDEKFMQTEIGKPRSRAEMLALFINKPYNFSPGTKWDYSNSGYMLLGYIIEDVTHQSYEKTVRDYIFTPLHMTNSGFDFTHLNNTNKATGYFTIAATGAIPAPIVDSSISFAAGAIYTTTGDLYKWYQGLRDNRVISKASKALAFTVVKQNYGYGFGMDSIYGKLRVSHGGGIHGFNSFLTMVPADDIFIMILNNTSNPFMEAIANNIMAILNNKPFEVPAPPVAQAIDVTKLTDYIGEYQLAPTFSITVTVKDTLLMAQATGQQAFQLFYEKADKFFLKVVDAKVVFTRDEKGLVTGLILFQNGQEVPGKKIH